MLHGKLTKSILNLNLAWNQIINNFSNVQNSLLNHLNSYKDLYLLINNNYKTNDSLIKTSLQNFISKFFVNYQSIFTLYIYKISKNIYKNTRGKSGKFMFLWKYVPMYKRLFIVSSWLVKELRLLPQRSLKLRLFQLLINMSKSPLKTWVSRVKTFSYNYVYRNCLKSLGSNYASVKV